MTDHQDQVTTVASRRRAIVIAGHQGDATTARVGLTDPSPEVRGSALGALERLQQLYSAELGAALTDSTPLVRRRAALVAAGRSDVSEALALLLDDPDDVVVEVAAFAWGERSEVPDAVLDRLMELATGHHDSLCREAAVAALGSIGEQRSLPAVLAATEDKATVRRRAVLALAAFDDDEATAALRARLDDRDLQVRQSAEELLSIEEGEST
ncbi:MAG TPA: HEAT repeat domain-containing protein [Microthrixaceae bacterium]|nr:HEAT repeat domain-containing protein [Microthrixaceae bacterium]